MKYDAIIILGPTASGKTNLSIDLAEKLQTEIVNADSMYVYKELNIGTAKPTKEEMRNIVHHLIDIVEPDEDFNVVDYRNAAKEVISDMQNRNLIPIIVGGTGLYIDSLINDFSYGNDSFDPKIRENINNDLNKYGKEHIYNLLKSIDPVSAEKLHVNDTKRVCRALEIFLTTGKTKSEITNYDEPIIKNPLLIGLNPPREILYDKINKRVDIMIENGLESEVFSLTMKLAFIHYDKFIETCQSLRGIGYREFIDMDRNYHTNEEIIEKIKQHSRNYAKRQMTWFNRNKDIIWFDPTKNCNIVEDIIDLYNKRTTN